jgi:hypothetical protein
MYARLIAALDALVQFVQAYSGPPDRALSAAAEEELRRLDSQLFGFCQAAVLSIPEVSYHPSSPYKRWGNAKIPHYPSNRGLHICATPNWSQAMGGLRLTAEILMEAPEEWVAGPSRTIGAGLPGATRIDDDKRWFTVSAAARIAFVNPGVISRAVKSGKLLSNGHNGSARRVCAIDLCRWIKARSGHREPTESIAQVEKKVRKHVRA